MKRNQHDDTEKNDAREKWNEKKVFVYRIFIDSVFIRHQLPADFFRSKDCNVRFVTQTHVSNAHRGKYRSKQYGQISDNLPEKLLKALIPQRCEFFLPLFVSACFIYFACSQFGEIVLYSDVLSYSNVHICSIQNFESAEKSTGRKSTNRLKEYMNVNTSNTQKYAK